MIQNKATTFGTGSGDAVLGSLMGKLFQTAVLVGGLALLLFMVWGGISWITAGGDKGKLEEARNRIMNAILGMAMLVGTIAVAIFLGKVLGVDLLNPTIDAASGGGGGNGGGGGSATGICACSNGLCANEGDIGYLSAGVCKKCTASGWTTSSQISCSPITCGACK